MKQQLIIFLVIVTTNLFAQTAVPNGGFENWTTTGSITNPDLWSTLNSSALSAGVATCQKGSPANYGNSYLKLICSWANNSNTVIPGIVSCGGTIDPSTFKVSGGFSFTHSPVSLTGIWQHMVMTNSSTQGFIEVLLSRWDGVQQKRDTVAFVHHLLSGMVMSWTNFSIPLTYNNNNIPDTCRIVLSASNTTNLSNGDYLYIDNLGFDGYMTDSLNTAIAIDETNDVTAIYPNPATDEIEVSIDKISNETELRIYNNTGQLLTKQVLSQRNQKINITGLSNGCYYFIIASDNNISSHKLIINR